MNKEVQTREIIQSTKRAEVKLDELLKEEEIWWAQRSRANWLKHGDKNTKFFHQKASQRKQRNWVDSIADDAGIIYEDEDKIEAVINSYFSQLFTLENTERVPEMAEVVRGKLN